MISRPRHGVDASHIHCAIIIELFGTAVFQGYLTGLALHLLATMNQFLMPTMNHGALDRVT
jgi:hypothetical protein